MIDGGLTVGDNISKLLNRSEVLKCTKGEVENEKDVLGYSFLINNVYAFISCTTDLNGCIKSMYYLMSE